MDKNAIKKYFRSGSRPTQEHFYALIDACYNEGGSICVPAYDLKTEYGDQNQLKSVSYEGGKTLLVPRFRRINIPNTRTYHYTVPCDGLADQSRIDKIWLYLDLPPSDTYPVKDKTSTVKVSQKIHLQSIEFFNGFDSFLLMAGDEVPEGPEMEFFSEESITGKKGVSVDITVAYDIKSNIAVSDEFDITDRDAAKLTHVFGGLRIKFKS